jgi:hypothetical protein
MRLTSKIPGEVTILDLFSPLAAILMLCDTLGRSVANAASLADQVNTAYATFDTAFNKSDAKTAAAVYTDDSLLLPGTGLRL